MTIGDVSAAIDVGSNSVRLLVACLTERGLEPAYQDRITSRLYQGMADNLLDKAAIDRTANAISALADAARAYGANCIFAFGTSAMRDGLNRDELITRCAGFSVPLEVLSGADEAQISYMGAAPWGRAGVIDIGGGSTEVLTGVDGLVHSAYSAQVGAVRLMELLDGDESVASMMDAAKARLAGAENATREFKGERFIGLGGTITTLGAMRLKLERYEPGLVDGCEISREYAEATLRELVGTPLNERKRIAGIDPQRADIMPYGVAILCAFFELSDVRRVYSSDRDNLLGYLKRKIGYL